MNTLYLVFDKPFKWIPPKYGIFYIAVEGLSTSKRIFHICANGNQYETFINGTRIPAIYSHLGYHVGNELQYVPILINSPVDFYFLDKSLKEIKTALPSVKLKVMYE